MVQHATIYNWAQPNVFLSLLFCLILLNYLEIICPWPLLVLPSMIKQWVMKKEEVYLLTVVTVLGFSTELLEFDTSGCREAGVVIKNVDILSGEVTLNLTEELVHRKKFSSDACSHAAEVASSTSKESRIKQAALLSVKIKKCISMIPEKVRTFKLWIHTISSLFNFYPSILT